MKRANTCRTCVHRITRNVLGMNARNHYCGHPEYDTMDSAVSGWTFEFKPNRCLPVTGARDCPGHKIRLGGAP